MSERMPLPEILRSRARYEADRRAFAFVDDHGQETAVLTYGELHSRALSVAGELRRYCAPGDRAILLFPAGLDFVVAYFACLYSQVIAVPVGPPHANRVPASLRSIIEDCRPSAVLTVDAMHRPAEAMVAPFCGDVPWLSVDRVELAAEDVEWRPCSWESLAFLQYTSGSTATPKGVMVSHGNLVANQEMIERSFGHDQRSTFVGWTPLHHDQGLIGNVLHPLYLGVVSILLAPTTFIRNPLLWLTTISRYRAHTSGGPNFAFDACVARAARNELTDLDLSCWKVAFNGAEPIRPETLRRFAETFAPFGFDAKALYPCYGLAEATLLATGSRKGRGPRLVDVDAEALEQKRLVPNTTGPARRLVGSGLAPDGVRIVDPESTQVCPPDRIGEIWVSGDHVTHGYWNRPKTTETTFRARCHGEEGGPYLRTGDVGGVFDGELFVVGRLKDLIIIRGRNYYPQDIEHTVQTSHPALRPTACAAFGVAGASGEKLVVVQEIRREGTTSGTAEINASIRASVLREHGLSIGEVVLASPGQLEKTSSGKIMRSAAKKRYLAEEFEGWSPPTPSP